jgi:ABC-type dipeptide/oligopeptide/nickel transport system permease component
VLAIVLIVSAVFVALNLIVDVLYSVIDPRVRR